MLGVNITSKGKQIAKGINRNLNKNKQWETSGDTY